MYICIVVGQVAISILEDKKFRRFLHLHTYLKPSNINDTLKLVTS